MFRIVVITIWLVVMLLVGAIAFNYSVDRNRLEADARLTELSSRLAIELDKFRTLPKVLALHPAMLEVLQQQTPTHIAKVNKLLSQYNSYLASDAVYLLAQDGIAISASNWQAADSFVGNDYAFRPYFQEAIKGKDGSYFALGTVSGKRGYYFSFPVMDSERIMGVLVIKVALSVIEEVFMQEDSVLLLTDNHGAIFYSSLAQWNYTALTPIPPAVEDEMIRQKQYGAAPLTTLTQQTDFTDLLNKSSLSLPVENNLRTYQLTHQNMPQMGWKLLVLTPFQRVYSYVGFSLLFATLIYVLLVLLSVYWRRNLIAQRQLAAVNEQLEHRVEQRTAELRETQNELIQAGKLALLGELSASINHELNQPLTALRTYSETLRLMIKKGKTDGFAATTEEIIKLTAMMTKIVAQYKLFARKSAGKMGPVLVRETLQASIAILESKIQKMGANVSIDLPIDDLSVLGESVPLEQVLVNLLNNALQAQEESTNVAINIAVTATDSDVKVAVRDCGPGLDHDTISHVFEPFFTTKGRGLGLGLTISQRIMESFSGSIEAENNADGGAVFTLTLVRYKNSK